MLHTWQHRQSHLYLQSPRNLSNIRQTSLILPSACWLGPAGAQDIFFPITGQFAATWSKIGTLCTNSQSACFGRKQREYIVRSTLAQGPYHLLPERLVIDYPGRPLILGAGFGYDDLVCHQPPKPLRLVSSQYCSVYPIALQPGCL